jgi:hypothetical protein
MYLPYCKFAVECDTVSTSAQALCAPTYLQRGDITMTEILNLFIKFIMDNLALIVSALLGWLFGDKVVSAAKAIGGGVANGIRSLSK